MKKAQAKKVAIIETGGKQYLVQPGDTLKVELIRTEKNQLTLRDLLANKNVTATILTEGRHPKVSGRIFRNKVRSSRFPRGHKQRYTALKIESMI
ncbi:bL21 family ribosomal protein [Candidatus Berkelbacteria bacterium]|nr:bL21 family ribosomal protein [Candidatus Berkelbacteria bacterium]